MKTSQSDRGALILMAVTVTLWGFSWIVMKGMSSLIGPFDLVMVRYALAFILLLVLLLLKGERLRRPPLLASLGIGIFQTAAFQCLCQLALITGGAGHVVMLAYTMPFWVVLFAWLLLGDRPTRRHIAGFVFAGVGLVAIISPWKGLGSVTGSLLALAGGMSWGLGAVLAKQAFQRHQPDVLSMTAWQMLLGAILTWPVTIAFPQPPIQWSAELVWGVVYLGAIASGLGWWLWMSVVRRVSATIAGLSSLGVPVLTVILAWIFLSERPTAPELIGVSLILGGLVVVNFPTTGARSRAPDTTT